MGMTKFKQIVIFNTSFVKSPLPPSLICFFVKNDFVFAYFKKDFTQCGKYFNFWPSIIGDQKFNVVPKGSNFLEPLGAA